MPCIKLFFFPVFYLAATAAFSQHYFAYGSSNYGGVAQVISNPAAAAGSLLKLDVLLGGGKKRSAVFPEAARQLEKLYSQRARKYL